MSKKEMKQQSPQYHITVSDKLIVTHQSTGEVVVDTRPRNAPLGDVFQHVLSLEVGNTVVAALKYNPWIYVFNIDLAGDVSHL